MHLGSWISVGRLRNQSWRPVTVVCVGLLLGLLVAGGSGAEAGSDRGSGPPGTLEFEGRNLFGKAEGTFHKWRVVESAVEADALASSFALIEVDLASVDTGIKGRDDHLRDPDFFEVETYPFARVRVHSPAATGLNEAAQPTFRAQFDIDLHGVQKTLEGQIVQVSESPLAFEGSLVLNRTDFGVGAPGSRWNPMSIKVEIPIEFRIEL